MPDGQAQWFGEELVPALRREGVHGPVTDDPSRTVVVGSRFGALSALFAVARRPEAIGSAIAQSPSLWRYDEGALVQPLVDADRAPLRLRLQAGTEEGLVPGARDLTATLVAQGVDAAFAPRTGGHDWTWWLPGIVDEAALLLR